MSKEKLIFVTNDDGYNSKGIEAAIEIARKFGKVIVIAPETVQSGKSQAVTMNIPLFLRTVSKSDDVEIYAFSGTPVDCVKFGFDLLLKDQKVDLVISGINHGSNSAISVLYSGTMGAAIEGSFYGCPAIGLSVTDHSWDANFEAATHYGEQIVRSVIESGYEEHLCLNVNIPDMPIDKIKGVKVCRQNRGYWKEEFVCNRDPRGQEYYWLTGDFVNHEPESTDTDEWALQNGYVSVVPVQVDMTAYSQMKMLNKMLG